MVKEKIANAKAYFKNNQRRMILLVCSIVVVGGLVTGTLAWLSSRSGPVINNFIGSNLEINLAEEAAKFQMIPHLEIEKDPVVTVEANSEACWLFLQVKESDAQANGSGITEIQNGVETVRTNKSESDLYKYLRYDIIIGSNEFDGWTKMTDDQVVAAGFPTVSDDNSVNTYYYRKVGEEGTALDSAESFNILVDNKVIVNDYIINDEFESQLTVKPVTITFTPAAVQRLGFNFTDAGKEISQFFH